MKPLMLIVNPAAGRGAYEKQFGQALNILYNGGFLPTLYFTAGCGDATRFAAEHGSRYELVCCLGGDGTLSETVSGLMQIDAACRPPIGYFPLGTTNDVATTLGLPKNDLPASARAILTGKPVSFDVGCFGSDAFFTYVAAFGMFTDVSYETPQQQKQALGHLAYVLEGMTRLPHIAQYKTWVTVDDGEEEALDLIFGGVVNSTSVAGLVRLNTETVALNDGKFELALVRPPHSLPDFRDLVTEVINPRENGRFLSIRQAERVRFRFEQPVPWTRDGEAGGAVTELTLTNSACAVRFIV